MDQNSQNYWQSEDAPPNQPETPPPAAANEPPVAPAPSPRAASPKSAPTPLPAASSEPQVGNSAPPLAPEPQVATPLVPAPKQTSAPRLASGQPANSFAPAQDEVLVEWQASEYIHHDKGASWYAVLAVVTVVAAGIALLLQQWLFAALIAVMGVALGVYAKRPPRELHYGLTFDGIEAGQQFFAYNQFRSFSIVGDGAFYALQLRPVKRFMPGVTIYFAEQDGEQIVDVLAARLPMEDAKTDAVDRLMRWLRF